jgi:predicted metalloprotease
VRALSPGIAEISVFVDCRFGGQTAYSLVIVQDEGFGTYRDFTYSVMLEERAIRITGFNGRGDVVIPETIHSLSVKEIGYWAMDNNNLTSVVIPNTVTHIRSAAFDRNQISRITFGDSLTYIGSWAFKDNLITSITLPNSLESIGNEAFAGNILTRVTIGDDVDVHPSAFNHNWTVNTNFNEIYDGIGGTFTRRLENHRFWTRE